MHDINWLHELILGALTGNIVILIGIIKLGIKWYKNYDTFVHRHRLMWLHYCRIHKIKPGREFYDRADEDTSA